MEPVSMACMAERAPAWRIDRTVPLKPGKMPSRTSGKPTRVASSRVAIRQWQASASSRPPPRQKPWMQHTTGTGMRSMRSR
jgi:hypothetical protein